MTASRDFNILDHGAAADGITDDAAAIQRAVDACAASGGGRVVIPAGRVVMAGSFELRSHVEFHVARGARLLSATTLDAFPRRVFSFGAEAEKRLWIGCRNAENVALSGEGTIDGRCRAFALEENEHIVFRTLVWRPAMTCFENVRGLRVRDLTLRDSANWTLHFTGCQDVDVAHVKIFNDLKFPNADGIDPDHCRRVRIRDCHIVSADDCIVLKNTAPFAHYGPCEDIEITGCRLQSASAAFKVGSESHNAVRRVRMSDCRIERSNRGLAIQLRDQGDVEDFAFESIEVETLRVAPAWWGAGEPIYVTALPRNDRTSVGSVRAIRFSDIRCRAENGIVVYSAPAGHVADLSFERVRVAIERRTAWPSGLFDLRPHGADMLLPDATPAGDDTPWGRPMTRPCAAVSIEGAELVRFSDVVYSLPAHDTADWTGIRADGPVEGIRCEDGSLP